MEILMTTSRLLLVTASSMLAAFVPISDADASIYVATFHGTVLSGFDSYNLFGGGDLTGDSFTAKFWASFTPTTLVTNTGTAIAVGGTPSSTPIFSTLEIKGYTQSFTASFIGLFGLAYNDPAFGNGVALQAVAAPFNGLAVEVENFNPLTPILNGSLITPVTYHVQPSDTTYGFFAINAVEFGFLAPETIDVELLPEPSSLALMSLGLGLTGLAMRWRRVGAV
jgi:hypothetical protein